MPFGTRLTSRPQQVPTTSHYQKVLFLAPTLCLELTPPLKPKLKLRHNLATVQKILTEILPPSSNLTTTKDYRDALIEACVEFITMISSEANEISEKDAKKTISAEHVAMALKSLGFESYVGPVMESADEYKKMMAVSCT